MQFLKRLVIVALLAWQWMAQAHATDLLAVYRLAQLHDAQYQAALLRFKGDLLTLDMSRARYKPNVTFTYRVAHNDYESSQLDASRLDVNGCADLNCIVDRVNQLHHKGTDASYESQQASLLLTQTIYDGSLLADNKKATAFIEKSKADLLDAEKELIMRVVAAYLKVLKVAGQKQLYQQYSAALTEIRDLAEKRYRSGVGKESDWYQAQAAYDAQQLAYEVASAEYTLALQQLSDMSGETLVNINRLAEDMPLSGQNERTLEQWLALARDSSNVLQAARAFEQVSYFDMQSRKGAGLPRFNFAISYADDDYSGGRGFSPAAKVMAYGVEMKWPLYQGGGVDASSKQAAYRLEESREKLRQLQQGIETGIHGLFMAIATDEKRYVSAGRWLISTTALEKIAKKAWYNGSGTMPEWFEAQKNLLQAKESVVQVRYDYIKHRISLQRLAGELSVKNVEQINAWFNVSAQ